VGDEVEVGKLNPNLPYLGRKSNPVTYDVDFSAVVTPPYHAKVLKVWLPMPQSDAAQEVKEKDLSSFPQKVQPKIGTEKTFGNKFAYFEFDHPEGAQIIRHRFQIKTWELRWDVDPAKVAVVKLWPAAFDPFLKGDRTIVVDERFLKLARQIVPTSQGEGKDLAAVMAWINRTMKYDHALASLRASSEHALNNKAGHCSDYHGFCAALGRALGYPTRVAYGINPFPKNSPSHCKLEAFLPPYG
jgi:transglutaminase-like putative cysteine protease